MITIHKGIDVLISVLRLILQIHYYICESTYHTLFGIPKKNVAGEIVLITGAGHGIGKELAIQYAQLGATVVCLDVNQQSNEKTANEIKEIVKSPVYTYQCDISKQEQILEVVKKIKEEVGDVTILINNAGIMPCHAFLDYTNDQIKQLFDINILAHFWMLQAFLPSMIKKNYGHIVALSSIAGLIGIPYLVPYSATKYAVRGLMETFKDELRISSQGKSLINFTTAYPYMVNTGLCKKPKISKLLPNLLSLSSPKYVATQIINAQRQNIAEISIPALWSYFISFARVLPEKAQFSIKDFLDSGVEPDS